jgi:Fe-S-cluster containining protein
MITRILRMARSAHQLKTDFNRKWARRAAKEHKLACLKCKASACCYQFVIAHIFEGVMIANWLIHNRRDDLGKKLFVEAVKQGKVQGQMLKNDGFYDGDTVEESCNNWSKTSAATSTRWFDQQIPCAFLHEGKCIIYGLRPTACATYYVVNHPEMIEPAPGICGPPSGKMVPCSNNMGPSEYSIGLDGQFIASLQHMDGIPIAPPVPLGTAVFYGMELLTKGPRALDDYVSVREKSLYDERRNDDQNLQGKEGEEETRQGEEEVHPGGGESHLPHDGEGDSEAEAGPEPAEAGGG